MSKYIKLFLITWSAIFVISLFVADDLDVAKRVIFSLILAVFSTVGVFFSQTGSKSKTSITKSTASTNNKIKNRVITYIYEGEQGRIPIYRIEDNRIYKGMSPKFDYEIKNNKICYPFSEKWLYRIEKNLVYKGQERQKAIYRIDGNKIYNGEFGHTIAFRISNSRFES